jgi:Arc/MetJ-type ribon-helix-helix transcriptional regulator
VIDCDERITIRISSELLEDLEESVGEEFPNRSEAARAAMRERFSSDDPPETIDRAEPTNRADLWGGGDA